MIYLDYAATTPIDEEVFQSYIKVQKNFFANPNSLHKLGLEAKYMLENAKSQMLDLLDMKEHDVIYTTNATEANNLCILGVCNNKSGRIITTRIEHPSVYEVYKNLESKGYDVKYLDVNENGIINVKQLMEYMTKDTVLVSIMWVNNIVGSIQPIKEVIDIVKKYPKCKIHIDAVQGLCKVKEDFKLNDVDFLTFSTHKIYGPKGIGCLILKKNIELNKIMFGSSSQRGIKPGTMDLALIVATTKALKKFYPNRENDIKYVQKLNNLFFENIINNDKIIINSKKINNSPYIINISIPTINAETIVHYLEEDKIYVSTGSSCSSKLKKPEKTILAMTNSELIATTAIRISLSHLTTSDEILKLIGCINKITGE